MNGCDQMSGSDDQTACVWTLDGTSISQLIGHSGGVLGVACKADLFVTGSGDCTVKLWDEHAKCTAT